MLRRRTFLTIAFVLLAGALPARAEYAPEASRLDWFVAVSDSHIGSGDRAVENLTWMAREGTAAIQPTLLMNCGDLTDATGWLPVPTGPQEEEWQQYRQILDDAGMTPDYYVDLPGNHDQYADKDLPHYLKYSIQGSADGKTQHSLRREGPAGIVQILATATPANNGGGVLQDNASLDVGELAFIQKALEDNADAQSRLVFGHHPVDRDIGNSIEEGKEEFKALLERFDADAYIYGHTHAYLSEYQGRTLHLNLDSLGKSDSNHVAVVALDAGTLSARTFSAAGWPYVLVTAPVDVDLGGGNPRAYSVPPGWTQCPVRALVFGDRAPDGVRFRVDGGAWSPMAETAPHVWAATFDSTGMNPGHHTLRVQASPWNANDHEIAFRVGATTCSNGVDDDFDGLTDWPEDAGCASPAGDDEAAVPPPIPDDAGGDDAGGDDIATPADEASDIPSAEAPGEDVALADPGPRPDEGSLPDVATGDLPVGTDLPPGEDARDIPVRDGWSEGVAADVTAASCLPGALRCDGSAAQRCQQDGKTWATVESCADRGMTCEDGECTGRKGGGCSAAGRPDAPAVPWLLLALGLLPLRSIRRRTIR